jgi:hypothetical protein
MITEKHGDGSVSIDTNDGELFVSQRYDLLIIDKQQAAQLIEVLQRWVDGEEIE